MLISAVAAALFNVQFSNPDLFSADKLMEPHAGETIGAFKNNRNCAEQGDDNRIV